MRRTIRLQLGSSSKYLFEKSFDTEDAASLKSLMNEYLALFQSYRETHNISSRRWKYPTVYFKDEDRDYYPRYKITLNGNWINLNQ